MVSRVEARPYANGKGWAIRGDTTQETDLVAEFSRSIYEKAGVIVARHTNLRVAGYFQYKGYSKALLTSCFPLYRRIRVAYIELEAVDHGALVWPRLGWSLHGASIGEVHAEIGNLYAARHRRRPPNEFDMPLFGPDVLELEDHEGFRIGEETLKTFARSGREISMRLYLASSRALAGLARRGIL